MQIETANALHCVRVDYLAHDSFPHTMITLKKNLDVKEKKTNMIGNVLYFNHPLERNPISK